MIIKPFELIPINTRHDVIDFIYKLYLNSNSFIKRYVFSSIIYSSDNVHLDTYYDQCYIEIDFNDVNSTIELDIQIEDKYKLNDTEPHNYTCSIVDFIVTKHTGKETNAVSMILNVIYNSKEFINKAIQEDFDTQKSLISITRAIKE